MIKNLSKRYKIKIPNDIKTVYLKKKNIIVFKGPSKIKALKIDFILYLINNHNIIYVTKISDNLIEKKNIISSLRGTNVSKIKQLILEVSVLLIKKLKLIGVGYKVFPVTLLKNELLEFKLGYSHFIYFKIPKDIKIITHKSTSLYIFGHSYYLLNQIASNIRKYKI